MFSPESRMASSSVLQDLRQTVPLQPGYAPCGQTVPGPVAVHVAQARVRALLQRGDITEKEYRRAKKYYQPLTGADIVLTD